jgi:hypothetical protein
VDLEGIKAALRALLQALGLAKVDQIVEIAARRTRERITTANGLDNIVWDIVSDAERRNWLRALAETAGTKEPSVEGFREIVAALDALRRARLVPPAAGNPRELRLKIEGTEDRAWSVGDGEEQGVFKATSNQLSLKTIDILQDLNNKIGLDEAGLKVLGSHLFQILFAPTSEPLVVGKRRTVLQALRDEWEVAVTTGSQLRIVLQFAAKGVSELALLPWEFLHVPEGVLVLDDGSRWPAEGFFVATENDNVSFLRQPGKKTSVKPCAPPLNVMTIDARDPGIEVSGSGWWLTIPGGVQVAYQHLERPTLAQVTATMSPREGRAPHVLHIVGEAAWIGQGVQNPLPAFRLSPGESGLVAASKLWDQIRRADVRLVVIEAVGDSYVASVQAASALVAAGCPAAVAMRQSDTAVDFITAFYEAINDGYFIDFAMNRARRRIEGAPGDPGYRVMFLYALDKIVDAASRTADAKASQELQVKPGPAPMESSESPVKAALLGRTPVGGGR